MTGSSLDTITWWVVDLHLLRLVLCSWQPSLTLLISHYSIFTSNLFSSTSTSLWPISLCGIIISSFFVSSSSRWTTFLPPPIKKFCLSPHPTTHPSEYRKIFFLAEEGSRKKSFSFLFRSNNQRFLAAQSQAQRSSLASAMHVEEAKVSFCQRKAYTNFASFLRFGYERSPPWTNWAHSGQDTEKA